jgi:5-formyltetrahydrofolate cyclo-ligase
MDKAELRTHLKQLRQKLTDTERESLGRQICSRLEAINWSEVRTVHCFEPIAQLGEVDISTFVATLQKYYPKIQLYTSQKIDGDWKIVSWQSHNPAQELQFDAVIVPMLGFDSSLHRIGYGGGYYDKFLVTQKRAKKIGVCFQECKIQYVPTEPHDVALDTIVTESTVY